MHIHYSSGHRDKHYPNLILVNNRFPEENEIEMVWSCKTWEGEKHTKESDGAGSGGRRPLGRLKKTWNKVVEEDMRKLNMEDMAES